MKRLAAEVLQDFVSLFFPRCCVACSDALLKGENSLCTACMLEIPQTDHFADRHNRLYQRLANRLHLQHAMALFKFTKGGKVQHLLHALKYNNRPEVGTMLGKYYGEKLAQAGLATAFDYLLPVPLHRSRLRKRGYNQSAMFAEGLSQKLHVPFSDSALARSTRTATQTRKTKLGRWQNVEHVFDILQPENVQGKRILLLDDVVTTGATLEACAGVLHAGGCASVSIGCIAEA